MTKKLVEGYFIATVDNLIFEIKGLIHPKDRLIAYLRYIPAKSETPNSGIEYKKVYALDERETYLKNNFPVYLWFSKLHGRIVQSVPVNRIKSIFDPVDFLANLRDSYEEISNLEKASVKLVGELVKSTGVRWSDIGVTGSQLIGVAKENSDIDLVIYGAEVCRKFYSNLSENIASLPGIERYARHVLDKHVSFRWGEHKSFKSILRIIEQAKILQGLFEGYHFFVRLVKNPSDIDYSFDDISFQMKGQQLISGKIVENIDSIFTPCEYLVECREFPDLRKLISYRGRFTEQISKDASFEALGRLETVNNHKEKKQYMQLVLGEQPSDYLIPK
ncbi:MAG: nucleotidyltransferase domain-containing protein [Candidatus Thorarchaeota archaeon]